MINKLINIYLYDVIITLKSIDKWRLMYMCNDDYIAIIIIVLLSFLGFMVFCSIKVDNIFIRDKKINDRMLLLIRWEKYMDNDFCFWTEIIDDEFWEAECTKNGFSFFDGSPIENYFIFCPYCGRILKENKQKIRKGNK